MARPKKNQPGPMSQRIYRSWPALEKQYLDKIPTRLRQLREVSRLTINEVSEAIAGYWPDDAPSPSMLQQLETGTRGLTAKVAIVLAQFYRVSLDYIFGLSDNPELRYPAEKLGQSLETNIEFLTRFFWEDANTTDNVVRGLEDDVLINLAERLRREVRRRNFNQ